MTNERKAEILDQLINWICMHEDEFIQCAVDATNLSKREQEELELITSEDEDEEDESLDTVEKEEYYHNVLKPQISNLNNY